MKTIRIISLILSICLMVSALSACSLFGGAKLPNTVGEDGKFIFKVIRSQNASDQAEEMAKVMRNTMRENFDCKVDIGKDETTEYDKDAYELLIGDTNRPESAEAKEVLANSRANTAFDFIVKVIGKKVCIQATNDEMISIAGAWFTETFCDSIEDWRLLTSDYEFIYSKEFEVVNNQVGGVDLGIFTLVKPLFGEYMALMEIEQFIDFYGQLGYNVVYNDDVDKEEKYEILLGDCDREASKSVTVEGDNYVIKVVGTKIVVKGGNTLSTFRAIRHFMELVKAVKNGGEAINWNDGYVINGKYDANESGTYTLNWIDDFSGSKVDLSIWTGHISGTQSSTVLGGKQWRYGPANNHLFNNGDGPEMPGKMSYITDGKWAFEHYRVDKDFFCQGFQTMSSVVWRYGVAEISIQVPEAPSSVSLWFNLPRSSWTLENGEVLDFGSGNTFTEIDLIENYGHPNSFDACVHRWWTEPSLDGLVNELAHNVGLDPTFLDKDSSTHYELPEEKYGADGMADKAQHVYSWYWDKDTMKFAFDGRRWCTYNFTKTDAVSIHNLFTGFIIGSSFGNSSYGATWKEGHPDYTIGYVDYCRVFQSDATNCQMLIGKAGDNGPVTKVVYPNHTLYGTH